MRSPIIATAFLILMPFITHATQGNLRAYHDHFQIQRNDDGDKIIVDAKMATESNITDYIKNLATYLVPSREIFGTAFLDSQKCAGAIYENENQGLSDAINTVFNLMKKSNLGVLLLDKHFLKMMTELENAAKPFTTDPDYTVMANLNTPNYFFKKDFAKFLEKRLVGLAEAYIGTNAAMTVVNYIAHDYANQIAAKKIYHESILAYYLETFPASQLGLTESERKRALSSIYDARLSFSLGGFLQSRKIVNDFEGYGVDHLQSQNTASEQRWEKNKSLFDRRGLRINSSFDEAVYKQSTLTFNFDIQKSTFNNKPSLAFDPACPDLLYKERQQYELIRVGVGFFPIPYVNKFFTPFKSYYRSQTVAEGALYAYLESTQQTAELAIVKKQSMNPLLK